MEGRGLKRKGGLNKFLHRKRGAFQRVGGEEGLLTFSLGKRRAFQRGGAYLRGRDFIIEDLW